jgi:hypothetical protein
LSRPAQQAHTLRRHPGGAGRHAGHRGGRTLRGQPPVGPCLAAPLSSWRAGGVGGPLASPAVSCCDPVAAADRAGSHASRDAAPASRTKGRTVGVVLQRGGQGTAAGHRGGRQAHETRPQRGCSRDGAWRLCWWACQDLNLGPHPYQLSRAKRYAERRFPRSRVSVRREVMRSNRVVPSGANKPDYSTCFVRESRIEEVRGLSASEGLSGVSAFRSSFGRSICSRRRAACALLAIRCGWCAWCRSAPPATPTGRARPARAPRLVWLPAARQRRCPQTARSR